MSYIDEIYDSSNDKISIIKDQLERMDLYDHFKDPQLSDICIQNYGEIQLKTMDGRWSQIENEFITQENCEALKNYLLTFNNKSMENNTSEALSFPSGERCHIVVEPECEAGHIIIVIRKYSDQIDTLENYERNGCFDHINDISPALDVNRLNEYQQELYFLLKQKDYISFFKLAVKYRLNIALAGAMFSGKTYFHRILLSLVDPQLRIALIQTNKDVVMPHHPNVFHLFYEENCPEQASKLLRDCLRLSIDIPMIAEIRSLEAWDLLKLMNIGHSGIIFTLHEERLINVFDCLTDFAKSHPVALNINRNDILQKFERSVDLIVYMRQKKISELFYRPRNYEEF